MEVFFIKLMRRILPKDIIYKLRCLFFNIYYMIRKPEKEFVNANNSRKIIMVNTPEHDNLGDHAITYAQELLIAQKLPSYYVVEITHHSYLSRKGKYMKYVTDEDIITINGGGYLGSMWFHNDLLVRDILNTFKNNKIVFFPQTIYYENFNKNDIEFNKTRDCFRRHGNIILCLREKRSYNFVLENFSGCYRECLLTPDIVLHLNENTNLKRKGMLLCFRKDIEKLIDKSFIDVVLKYSQDKCIPTTYTDTLIGKIVTKKTREKELKKKLYEFMSAELVVTDRLHGMIFAAITSTPCIAFNNRSKKVEGVYDWIRYLSYISLVNNVKDIYSALDNIDTHCNYQFSNQPLNDYFKLIIESINEPKVETLK